MSVGRWSQRATATLRLPFAQLPPPLLPSLHGQAFRASNESSSKVMIQKGLGEHTTTTRARCLSTGKGGHRGRVSACSFRNWGMEAGAGRTVRAAPDRVAPRVALAVLGVLADEGLVDLDACEKRQRGDGQRKAHTPRGLSADAPSPGPSRTLTMPPLTLNTSGLVMYVLRSNAPTL